MKSKNNIFLSLLLGVLGMSWLGTSYAVPSFAAKYEKKCSYCHTAWPQLSAKGRAFKERGYRLKEDLKDTSKKPPYAEQGTFPISAMLISRPYDKKDSGETKNRALHEAEIFIAGAINDTFSAYLEIEAEDEPGPAGTPFEPTIGPIVGSMRISDEVNIQAVWGPALWADPYGLLGDHFRLTRGHVASIDKSFGGAEGKIRDTRQSLNITGRVAKKVFYSAGYAAQAGDGEGEDPSTIHARIAYDIKKDLMVGAFIMNGTSAGTPDRDFSRTGIDFQGDFGKVARVQALYVMAEDDNAGATASEDNNAMSVQAYFPMKTKDGSPTYVPLVRYDTYEQNDGADEYTELTLNLTYYFNENVKGYVEYWDQLDVPTGEVADNRMTFQFYVAF